MKQCPQCGSIYSDDTLNFCLTDRASLVAVNDGEGEPTVVRTQPTGRETQVITREPGVSPLFKYVALGLGVLLLLLAGAGLAAWSFRNSRAEQTQQTSNEATPVVGTAGSRAASNTSNIGTSNKDVARSETPQPAKTPAASPTPATGDVPQKDAGSGRITFKKGSVSQTMGGTLVHDRSFVLRTMAGQSLSARVSSKDGCVEFEGGGNAVSFATPNGDVSLHLTNTCDDPTPFSMIVTVR